MGDKQLSSDQRALGINLQKIWQNALVRLRDASFGKDEYKRLLQNLQMSVDSLEDLRLKECFYFFAAFPEDHVVDGEDLINIWVAEGLLENDVSGSVEFSAEVEGKLLLSCLVAKSMVHMKKHDEWNNVVPTISFRVYDVLRDVARHNLTINAVTGEKIPISARRCLYAPGLKLLSLPIAWTRTGVKLEAKRLTLITNDLQHFPEPESFCAGDLHVLMLAGNENLRSLSKPFFRQLSSLRVLDLRGTGIERIPDGVLRELSSLVHLDLMDCEKLEEISEEVSALQTLEFVMLGGCLALKRVPRVSGLKNLRCLSTSAPDLSLESDDDDEQILKQDGECGDMEELENQKALTALGEDTEPDGNKVEDVRAMEEENDDDFETLPQQKLARQDAQRYGTLLKLPTSLRELYLHGNGEDSMWYSFDVSCLSALEKMQLGEFPAFPAGMGSLHHLTYIKIWHMDDYEDAPCFWLGSLAKLEHLDMNYCSGSIWRGLQSCFDSELPAFPSLKYLRIWGETSTVDNLIFRPGIMPKLENLRVGVSRNSLFIASIAELQSLRWLELSFDPDFSITLFSQLPCLPSLERLLITAFHSAEDIRNILPSHVLAREQEGKLSLVIKER